MNKVELIGNFTKDPEVQHSQENQTPFVKFTLAVSRRFRQGGTDADFIQCTAFGKTADFIGKWFRKGSGAAVVGNLRTGNYTNKDGAKVYTCEVMVEEIEFAGRKPENTSPAHDEGNGTVAQDDGGFLEIPDGVDEELPFS